MERQIGIGGGPLTTALERMGCGVVVLDAAGVVVYAGEICKTLLGHSPKELVGRPVREFLTDDGKAIFAHRFKARRRGDHAAYEVTWRRGDGRNVDIHVVPVPLSAGDGAFTGSLGVLMDKSEQKRLEGDVATAKMIVNQSNALIYRTALAADLPIEYISGNLAHFGYTAAGPTAADSIVGRRTFAELVHPDDWPHVLAGRNRAVWRGAKFLLQRYRIRAGADGWRWVEDHATICPSAAGNAVYVEGLLHDISALKRADEAGRLAHVQTIRAIAAAIEKRDPYTAGHQRRVAELAGAIGRALALTPHRLEGLMLGGLVHDVGKIAIPTAILVKPGRLSPTEYELVKTHATIGAEVFAGIELPWSIAAMVAQHHERQDGSGYPRGIKGDEILLEARIIAVADVVEAMSWHRPYRPAIGLRSAAEAIANGRRNHFDSTVVDACIEILRTSDFENERLWPSLKDDGVKPAISDGAPLVHLDDARD